MIFKPVTLDTEPLINTYFSCGLNTVNDRSFGGIFAWKDLYQTEYAVKNDTLIIKYRYPDLSTEKYCFNISFHGDFTVVLRSLAAQYGSPVKLLPVCEEEIGLLAATFPNIRPRFDRNLSEYVYEKKTLSGLTGKKLQSKRNHINAYKRIYGEPVFEPITEKNLSEVIECQRLWYEAHRQNGVDDENTALSSVFKCFGSLPLFGTLLRTNGIVSAFAIGEQTRQNTVIEHFEKALPDFENAYTVIMNGFARSLDASVQYINREEDMGIEGLRRSKLSLCPVRLEKKYEVNISI